MIYELEKILEDAVMAYCKVPLQQFLASASETIADLSSRSSDKYPEPGPADYKTELSLLIFLHLIAITVRLGSQLMKFLIV
jgi:hypothetical protein